MLFPMTDLEWLTTKQIANIIQPRRLDPTDIGLVIRVEQTEDTEEGVYGHPDFQSVKYYTIHKTELYAEGFSFLVCGCKVSGQFKEPILIAEHIEDENGDELDSTTFHYYDDLEQEIAKVCGPINFKESELHA